MIHPRVVIGTPVFNRAGLLREAAGSLLAQTYGDLSLLIVDDRSTDGTLEVARELAAADPRVELHVNDRRVGMLENTRLAFSLARERFPEAPYWALGSDHDLWHQRWLETLVALLDADPAVVLAYPLTRRIDERGEPYGGQKPPWRFQTRGIADPRVRLRAAFRGMVAGDMVYGLFRASALDRVGMYRPLLVPDRLLLCELALRGEFAQADEVLWRRRFRGLAELDRQRRAFWPEGAPAYAHLPWWQVHAASFAWRYGIRGEGVPDGIGRAKGARLALDYLEVSVRHRLWRRARRSRERALHTRNALLAPPVRFALRSRAVRRLVRLRLVPALEDAEAILDRLTVDDESGT